MKIFVTGASGFVGGHVVETLSKTHQVYAMARSEQSARKVESLGAHAVRCSLGSVQERDLAGCSAVVHCAAFVEEWGTREQYWEGNVEGTTQLLTIAHSAGVSRFIHIGTEAALFDGHDLLNINETQPYPQHQQYLYSETKAEAERRVLAANEPGFSTVSLRPRLVWGPRDTSVLPAIVRMAQTGAWAWINHGQYQTSTTHVKNVVHAVDLALTHGRGGEAYFIADNGELSLKDFLSALAQTQKVNLPDRSIPKPLARGMSTVTEGIWKFFSIKRPPPMTRFAIAMMSSTITVDTTKASRDLGYSPVISVTEGLSELASLQS